MAKNFFVLCVCLAFLLFVPSARAGQLDDFEKEATKKHSSPARHEGAHPDEEADEADESCLEACLDAFLETCLMTFFPSKESSENTSQGPAKRSLSSSESETAAVPLYPSRTTGSARLPIARVDIVYGDMNSDVTAWDVMALLGYKGIAAQYRHTYFSERDPKDHLALGQAHLFYRMTWTYVDVSLGGGVVTLKGNESHTGGSFSVPVSIHPNNRWALIWRPTVGDLNGNRIVDHDLGLHFTRRYYSLQAGYRHVKTGSQTLHGPQVGAAFYY